ncbi:MAG: glycosyltransferase family 1 protein [Psychroserpens sp.]|uniref:glycosyltransferase family 4 protein n=1 Tax=Psychroserpens sp. TaxID=2020870 RepID=UPI003001A6BA
MDKTITYIKRKSLPHYHSIEGLFNSIKTEVSKSNETDLVYTKHSGGSPLTMLKNYLAFDKAKNTIYHITGDVHYMALVTGKRTVLTVHDIGSALEGTILKRLYIKLFWFWLPALVVKRITVISEFTKQELTQIIPFAKHKIEVIPNSVSTSFSQKHYTFNQQCPTILCVGTKSNKNLERIITGVVDINCKLHIIGELTSKQLELLNHFKINYQNSSNLEQEDIVKAYEACDMLCFPSTYEGFGMPIIEAQSVGRPVLTSNYGALLEVAKESACLVDPYNIEAIKVGIEQLISNANYRDTLINNGFENVKRFHLETIVKQYLSIYNQL